MYARGLTSARHSCTIISSHSFRLFLATVGREGVGTVGTGSEQDHTGLEGEWAASVISKARKAILDEQSALGLRTAIGIKILGSRSRGGFLG